MLGIGLKADPGAWRCWKVQLPLPQRGSFQYLAVSGDRQTTALQCPFLFDLVKSGHDSYRKPGGSAYGSNDL